MTDYVDRVIVCTDAADLFAVAHDLHVHHFPSSIHFLLLRMLPDCQIYPTDFSLALLHK